MHRNWLIEFMPLKQPIVILSILMKRKIICFRIPIFFMLQIIDEEEK